MTFKEVIEQGFKEVVATAYGYTEGRVFPTWQPFKHKREITFRIVNLGGGDGYLEHRTFILKDCEDNLDYTIKNGKVYTEDVDMMADIEY